MAELADVEQSLVNALIESVYPNGMSNASAIGVTVQNLPRATDECGVDCKSFEGSS